jgi:ABC-2 type transport system permease protein
MKLSEFKESIKERLVLLKISAIFTAQRELAYAANNWASILSTTFFTFGVLISINVIYSNVQSVAGYSHNDILMFFFVSQMTYYANWIFTIRSLNDLIPDVNKGNLDLVLVKPVPSYFFLMTRTISLVRITTEAIPPILAISFSMNWQSLNISISTAIIGVGVWILGLIALQALQVISALPVFWFGESENILDLTTSGVTASGNMIPLEGYSQSLQWILGTIIPMLIATGFTTSVLLGKSNPLFLLSWAIIVTSVFVILRNVAWKFALRHYTSASS